jgi:hypothetical protein
MQIISPSVTLPDAEMGINPKLALPPQAPDAAKDARAQTKTARAVRPGRFRMNIERGDNDF